ncbi:c-type cytochrome domain-containing protein [Thiobacillus sp.]|uniref:c-type cytochrome domain-containing protein n=1 Tax=Thiobacillus sp. TaxID=924 RepID=UPI0025F9F994|nr:c-type cytochrome domain-containing protein [Thiobacillus sp.]
MKRTALSAFSVLAVVLHTGCSDDRPLTYQARIKPILDTHCVSCHVPGKPGYEQSGLRLDSYEALMKGARLNPVVRPGSSLSSTLHRVVSGQLDPSIRMPHGGPILSEENARLIGAWIDQGAKY